MAVEDIVSITEFSRADIERFLDTAEQIAALDREAQQATLPGHVLATLFFEPSTRTRLSFQAAMQRLGGSSINLNKEISSLAKGETMYDTGKVVAEYADVAVLRSPHEGAARLLAENTEVPVINGGDGANQHPTQTLLDLYTIRAERGSIDGATIGMLGDLKYGRTVHSLAHALTHFDVSLRLISPAETRMPPDVVDELDDVEETQELEIQDLDVLYATRIQQERFPDRREYERVKGTYVLDRDTVAAMDDEAVLLHPLPRVDEVTPAVDELPQARYFAQAGNGVPVRMAVIAELLEVEV
ncbi:MAG: aspartate carbamoyltransferase [Candidatus Nanohaloarchaea archaeon]|nr:aspartate carbamoyltransferase [Candidatus Nanohaloarchaea archaeon]